MARIALRNVEDNVTVLLKQQAKTNGNSLNAEIKAILTELVKYYPTGIEF